MYTPFNPALIPINLKYMDVNMIYRYRYRDLMLQKGNQEWIRYLSLSVSGAVICAMFSVYSCLGYHLHSLFPPLFTFFFSWMRISIRTVFFSLLKNLLIFYIFEQIFFIFLTECILSTESNSSVNKLLILKWNNGGCFILSFYTLWCYVEWGFFFDWNHLLCWREMDF